MEKSFDIRTMLRQQSVIMTLLKVLLDKRHLPLVKAQYHMRALDESEEVDMKNRDKIHKVLLFNSTDDEDDRQSISRLLSHNQRDDSPRS